MFSRADRVRFILVRPQHPGNIGAAARALKNTGWSRLVIVSDPPPDMQAASILAAGSGDLLARAEIFPTLEAALEGVSWVVATTARRRQWRYPVFTSRTLGDDLLPRADEGEVAILFGQEDFGLDRDALARSHAIVRIPTVDLSSLNLGQAVLVLAYELMMTERRDEPPAPRPVATWAQVEPMIQQWMALAEDIDYFRGRNPEHLLVTLRQIFGRAALEPREANILRGFLRKARMGLRRLKGITTPIDEDDAS